MQLARAREIWLLAGGGGGGGDRGEIGVSLHALAHVSESTGRKPPLGYP